jgi:hypothetical protein
VKPPWFGSWGSWVIGGYGEFLQALRDFVDSDLTLPDRVDLPGMKGPGTDLLHRVVFEEMNNLRQFYEAIDIRVLGRIVDLLQDSPAVYVIGSRVSYTFAYYLGWSLTKVRRGGSHIKGQRQHGHRLADQRARQQFGDDHHHLTLSQRVDQIGQGRPTSSAPPAGDHRQYVVSGHPLRPSIFGGAVPFHSVNRLSDHHLLHHQLPGAGNGESAGSAA